MCRPEACSIKASKKVVDVVKNGLQILWKMFPEQEKYSLLCLKNEMGKLKSKVWWWEALLEGGKSLQIT